MAYIGQSMSEKAWEAYRNGEKPLSVWTKQKLLDKLEDKFGEEEFNVISKFSVDVLKGVFLVNSGWHHTGKYYNRTNFYDINDRVLSFSFDYVLELLNDEKAKIKYRKECKKKEMNKDMTFVRFEYIEWSGTVKHPRPNFKKTVGVLKGSYIYFHGKYRLEKKRTTTNGVTIFKRASTYEDSIFDKKEKTALRTIKEIIAVS